MEEHYPRPALTMYSRPFSSSSLVVWSLESYEQYPEQPGTRGEPVDPARHPAALLQLVDIKLSRQVIDYVVDCVSETVDHALGRTTTRGVAPHAPPTSQIHHLQWALERVFLGALIAASKYTNDSTLKNVHWALCTGVFGKRDVGRIEREFLDVLDWELSVGEADLMAHHAGLAFALAPQPVRVPEPKLLAVPRHTRETSVPELEPSSPQSSAASMSPRTPGSHHLSASAPAKELDVPMDVDSHPAHSKERPLPRPPALVPHSARACASCACALDHTRDSTLFSIRREAFRPPTPTRAGDPPSQPAPRYAG
ncbi:hypothetical protein DFH09DRAFT_1382723 [Mycena vulgaris]|nr:hypothetical protein DFH09DRAFT_1382723 [Mycena vulgaris]